LISSLIFDILAGMAKSRKSLVGKVSRFWQSLKLKTSKLAHTSKKGSYKVYREAVTIIDRRPILSFFSLLSLLFALIIISDILRRPAPVVKKPVSAKAVQVYNIGQAPKVTLQGQVEKSGVIQITSLVGGVVQNIYVTEGSQVNRGSWLLSLSSNYQGGNAATLSRQLAEAQNKNIEDSYPLQKELIGKQRDLANSVQDNASQLRDIASQSVDDTNNLISLNNDIISSLDSNINNLEASSSANADLILSIKELKSQFLSANLQLNNALRNTQYQADDNKPPAEMARLQKDITLSQLDIQEKALDLGREVSKLQLQLAQVNEATMFPSAPFSATVERIFVRVGQAVGPGTPLFTLSAKVDPPLTVNVYTTKDITDRISRIEPCIVNIGNKSLSLYPSYVSREAVQGNLYSIIFDLPQEDYPNVTDKGYVSVQVPVGYANTSAVMPYVPLDAIFQTQEDSFVYVVDNDVAKTRHITLGNVYGQFVQLTSGINAGDLIILDRSVVDGEKVKAEE
jgi:multidrug efflux pump subunit AcrA (membrane-fusion protein)